MKSFEVLVILLFAASSAMEDETKIETHEKFAMLNKLPKELFKMVIGSLKQLEMFNVVKSSKTMKMKVFSVCKVLAHSSEVQMLLMEGMVLPDFTGDCSVFQTFLCAPKVSVFELKKRPDHIFFQCGQKETCDIDIFRGKPVGHCAVECGIVTESKVPNFCFKHESASMDFFIVHIRGVWIRAAHLQTPVSWWKGSCDESHGWMGTFDGMIQSFFSPKGRHWVGNKNCGEIERELKESKEVQSMREYRAEEMNLRHHAPVTSISFC